MARRYWWQDSITVNVDYDDVIEQIPTDVLQEELNKRKELQHSDIKTFEKEENRRCDGIDIDVCPDDYGLVDEETVKLGEYFSDDYIIDYIESKGHTIVSDGETFGTIENVTNYLYSLPNYKYRDYLCDSLGLSRRSAKEEIIEEIKNRI